ncbi:MdtA/MuxA family multidrug efflux RND transporter periplasmic adaptor subunit [Ectopseudomonas alcaliphila]|uniref:MdtA/MuxA family multidrug efflux RND transporter periplasmic adaptor subunit n=1 Tax=Ectopseudomonas alcaliphila TaxID=101564 RepID=UPI002781F19B|nr:MULTISPECIES: MdtA/MuxA family multidrug efflux RND transporter periplasmic adaptor subunit [Pseudomonas]MDP9940394.1 multidrug efflux system membrane fusion protein [Pseudomonas sp. 3400]MDR7012040.1 multidrug efflux system membrane fusion protein [Pseudomonas alcaliphila]
MSNASSSPSNTSRQWLIGLTLLAVLLLLLWWFWPSTPQTQQTGRGRFGDMGPVPVRVAEVEQGEFAIELKALGTVTAYNTVNVRSRVDGELVKVLFEEGQQVKAGDLLAVIDPRPYQVALQQAQGALQENQAQLKNAELDLQRYKGLYDEDSIAKQTLDTQQALVNQFHGSLQSNQADVATAKLNLDFTQIRAPISGRLGLRQLDVGNLVSGGDTTPLVVITQDDPIAVIFTIPEGDLPAVLQRRRDGTILSVEAWDRGERLKLAEGVLESLDNQIDTTTGTVKLKARFDNAEQMLFPNQFVNVRLRVETREAAIIIPSAAVQFGTRGTFVYVVDSDSKVSIRQVTIAASDAERSLVAGGVQPGERLVLEGTDRLRDGSQVEVVDPNELQSPDGAANQPAGRQGKRDGSARAGAARNDA